VLAGASPGPCPVPATFLPSLNPLRDKDFSLLHTNTHGNGRNSANRLITTIPLKASDFRRVPMRRGPGSRVGRRARPYLGNRAPIPEHSPYIHSGNY
jgi:hypothetical protein